MKNKKTIFNYIGEAFITFATSLLFLIIVGLLVGEEVKAYSTMFALGNQGLSFMTMLQFFLMSFVMTLFNYMFFSERVFKNKGFLFRITGMCTSATIAVGVFARMFNWFPIDEWKPWLGYAISFLLFFIISTGLMVLKTNLENRKMEEALKGIKEKEGDENENRDLY